MRTTLIFVAVCLVASTTLAADRPPNIVLLFADDLGYADLGSFGAEGFKTPNLDQLAAEGTRFTNFYVSQPVCTASRASLMTGCYANRVGLEGALNHTSQVGIHPDEFLLPEICQQRNYATACYGKWHLGTRLEFFPTRNGFDEFFGIPYSNDNGPLHPIIPNIPGLPLYENEELLGRDPDQRYFTRWLTRRSVNFIQRNKDRPFLLYVPHIMPHVPIFASEDFRGTSELGLYGDVVQELDWSVGQVMKALKDHGLEENTLVIFLSDNGPFLSYGEHAGHADPLREGKLTTFEGGVRSPCIMRWPGQIPAGRTCHEVAASIDLVPTVAKLLEVKLPMGRKIDGKNILPLITGEPGAQSPHEALYFFAGTQLQAVRSGKWKLHFPHKYLTVAAEPGRGGKPSNFENLEPKSITQSGLEGIASRHGYRVEELPLSLYDLSKDPGETTNLAEEYPDVVTRLSALADKARSDLGDSLTGREGSGLRPVGSIIADSSE